MLPTDTLLIHWRWWEYFPTWRKASAWKYFAESRYKMSSNDRVHCCYPLVLDISVLFEYINDGEYEMTFCSLHCSEITQFTIVCHTDHSQCVKSSMSRICYCCFLAIGLRGFIPWVWIPGFPYFCSNNSFHECDHCFLRESYFFFFLFGMKMPIRLKNHGTILKNRE